MSALAACPSCRQPMQIHRFAGSLGSTVELDLCFACRGIWFDVAENTRLAPGAVLELFQLLHQHHTDAHHPVAQRLACLHCARALVQGFDVSKGGRYVTYRCPQRHGRFSTFGSFMVEKGFVRHLAPQEIEALAAKVGVISCSHCGGAVDIRQDHICPYCRSALALLDPDAVNQAIQRHAAAAMKPVGGPQALADALVAQEALRQRALRERQRERWHQGDERLDLLSAGVELVWELLTRR